MEQSCNEILCRHLKECCRNMCADMRESSCINVSLKEQGITCCGHVKMFQICGELGR